jgi:hypothetical protein
VELIVENWPTLLIAEAWRSPSTTDVGTPIDKLTAADGTEPKIGHRMYRKGETGERINQTQSLALQVNLWNSPAGGGGGSVSRGGDRIDEPLLTKQAEQATLWASASASDHKGSSKLGQRRGQLSEQTECLTGTQDQPAETSGSESSPSVPTSPRPRLNARFVSWLMGFPPGWESLRPLKPTSYERWVTQSSRLVVRLLS